MTEITFSGESDFRVHALTAWGIEATSTKYVGITWVCLDCSGVSVQGHFLQSLRLQSLRCPKCGVPALHDFLLPCESPIIYS